MNKKTFSVMVNDSLKYDLYRSAEAKAKQFKNEIYPILLRFDLLDDEHIERYLNCDTTEDIYKDALKERRRIVFNLEQQYLLEKEKDEKSRIDVWKFLRQYGSPVKSPNEEGFTFAKTPCSDCYYKDIVAMALSVKNGEILIDKDYLDEKSVIIPTDKQRELYDMLADFCEAFNAKKLHKPEGIRALFSYDKNGIFPNIHFILGKNFISKKRG